MLQKLQVVYKLILKFQPYMYYLHNIQSILGDNVSNYAELFNECWMHHENQMCAIYFANAMKMYKCINIFGNNKLNTYLIFGCRNWDNLGIKKNNQWKFTKKKFLLKLNNIRL